MYRPDVADASAVKPARGPVGPKQNAHYDDGTTVEADHLEAISEELANIVEQSGEMLNKGDDTQVLTALLVHARNQSIQANWEAASVNYVAHTNAIGTTNAVASNDKGELLSVGNNGQLASSNDGDNWIPQDALFGASDINCVAYSSVDGLWVVAGNDGKLATSPDRINWTLRDSKFGTEAIYSVEHDGIGLWLIGGDSKQLSTSVDGITWNLQVTVVNDSWHGIAYGAGLWVISGFLGNVLTSPDAVTWSNPSTPLLGNIVNDVTYNSNKYIIVGGTGGGQSVLATSSNGINWTEIIVPGKTIRAISSANGLAVAVNADGEVLMSTDNATWISVVTGVSSDLSGICYNGQMWVIVGIDDTVGTSIKLPY